MDTYSGMVKLGNGPEFHKQNADNIYEPLWVSVQEMDTIHLLPSNGKLMVTELLSTSF